VSVKLWVTEPVALVAVNVTGYVFTVPGAGVPESVAVPLPLSTKVTPRGRVPVSERVTAPGGDVVVTVNESALSTVNVVLDALVIDGVVGRAQAGEMTTKDRPAIMRIMIAKTERTGVGSLCRLNPLFLPFPTAPNRLPLMSTFVLPVTNRLSLISGMMLYECFYGINLLCSLPPGANVATNQ
jgi:hypothetical protein